MKKKFVWIIFTSLLMSLATGVIAQTVQNVEFHGYVQNRFYVPQAASARFGIERVSITAKATISDTMTGYVEIYHHPSLSAVATAEQYRTYVESAYMDAPLGAGRIRMGKGRQLNFGMTPSYPNRKTSQYGIVPEMFTQDRIVGFQYTQKSGIFDGGISLYEDTSLGTRNIGDFTGAVADDVVRHFVDKDIPADISGELAVSARVGITKPCFQAHISGATGALASKDLPTIYGAYGLATGTDDSHNKYGLDATYAHGPFVAQAEYYNGNISFLNVKGYNLLLGYTFPGKQRAYIRYNALSNDMAPTATQTTWDTQQWILAVVQPIAKNVWAELEYEKNSESTGAGAPEVDNDLLFLEIFTGF